MKVEVPDGSLYFWCFSQGLKHVALAEVESAVRCAGRELRDKDVRNYWEGWYRSDLYRSDAKDDIFMLKRGKRPPTPSSSFLTTPYADYPMHPYNGLPEIGQRWVPCNADNKPMIKWGEGCMSYEDAQAWPGQVYLAENTKGTRFIIVDCDGDHGDTLDFRTISRLSHYMNLTHCLSKPKDICEYEGYEETNLHQPASFHLTFTTDRIIPTMHFPYAGIDIIGNRANSLRYRKNKIWNGLEPIPMTEDIWLDLQKYVESRRPTNG